MKKYKVGIIGATGMVGERFVTLLENHPYFEVTVLAASKNSAGARYEDAVKNRWKLNCPIPNYAKDMVILDANSDKEYIAKNVDFIFCAVNMSKDLIKALEESYAKLECPVVSNNSANRGVSDIPMVIPEINYDHLDVIKYQRERLGTKKGFIAVKSNCSLQSYVPLLAPLLEYGIESVFVSTYQAISGAGKTFETFPEIVDNTIPYIGGEEEKSEVEPLKIFGTVRDGKIVNNNEMKLSATCVRIAVSDGHLATVFVKFKNKPTKEEIIDKWNNYKPLIEEYNLPSSPEHFITYFDSPDRPQPKLDRDLYNGMGISCGRLRDDNIFDYKFVGLSHNTKRGAAGGAILLAELLAYKGYFD